MKILSISIIMAFIISAAIQINDGNNASFWNVLYGFAAMLAVFDLINLKVRWAAVFGCVAYSILAIKIGGAPVATNTVSTGPWQIAGLAIAAVYCLCLVLYSFKKGPDLEPDGQKI
jgi:hypothetical protein